MFQTADLGLHGVHLRPHRGHRAGDRAQAKVHAGHGGVQAGQVGGRGGLEAGEGGTQVRNVVAQ
eukprot:14548692-Heterocapsa_arctica.AAC.1